MTILTGAPLLLLLLQAGEAPPAGLFISPMGEPFRSQDPSADNAGAWFAGADRNSDAALSPAELRGDAARFFATLDSDSDGEIEPSEIARYENEIASEVQVGLQMRGSGYGDWRGRGSRRHRIPIFDRGIEGAGRYSFLNIPQPVIAADADMNRGISRDEFAQAAAQRFAMLDKDGDGRLVRAELPPLPQPRLRKPRNDESDGERAWRRSPRG